MAWDDELDLGSIAYAIAAAPESRVRVIAGPGTGKSFAMKRRVARLLEQGTSPKEILAVTFTRVAAEDLHRELQKLGTPGCEELEGQTLHGLAMRILGRTHVLKAMGRVPRPLNKFEQRAMVSDLCAGGSGKKNCKKLIKAYEAAWAQTQGDEPGFPNTNEQKAFHSQLLDWLIFHEAMLIGELIPYLVRYLKDNPAAPEHSEFKHLLIDEYQDLNKAEQTALAYLGAHAEVCIVGDDDQSIYSFKCAHPDGIREWKTVNAGCADLEMTDCHRCPTDVVEMANAVIANNKNRQPRALTALPAKGKGETLILQLADVDAEAAYLADFIAELLAANVHPSEIIVLVQRKFAGKLILAALKAKKIPAKSYYEESQLDSEPAQHRFALFKLLLNNEDRVALRYLLGAGSTTFRTGPYARLRGHCEMSGDSPWCAMEKLAAGTLTLPHSATLIQAFKDVRAELTALEAVQEDLPAFIDALFPASDDKLEELRELALAESEGCTSAVELLRAMMEEMIQPDVPPTVEEVRVMSLHKSKGLSSPYVFIAGCVQGILPQMAEPGTPKALADAQLEEARRLFYVGITRVKADPANGRPGSLIITYAQKMVAGIAQGAKIPVMSKKGGKANLFPSIFIGELGPAAPTPQAA
jgi:superfamily I DNA/RNA helicase